MPGTAGQPRTLASALAAAAAVGYALVALASGIDRMGADDAVLAGMLPAPLAAQSLRNQATNAQSIGDADKALALAQMAVRRTPIEPSSTAVLGAALLGHRDAVGAERAFRVAAQMGWRVPLTQLYWMQASLAYGDYANAAIRLDALLRQDPTLLRNRDIMDPLEGNDEGRAALADQLVEKPEWLDPYVSDVANTPDDVLELRRAVLHGLAERHVALGCEAISPFVERELDLGNVRGADDVWRGHCPSARDAILFDGDFARAQVAQTRASLAWTFVGNAGISVLLEPGARPGTRALAVDGTVQRPMVFVRQLLLLQPGPYRVSWRASAENGATSSRIVVALNCGQKIDWQAGTPDADGRRSAVLAHDGACEAPWLLFALAPGNGAVQLSSVSLTKAGSPAPR